MKLCVFNKFDKQLNIIHKMKLQFNSKLLLMLTLSAASVSNALGSDWTGEDKPTGTTTYYLYNTVTQSWLGNNGSAAPTLGAAQYRIPFTVTIAGDKNDDWTFRYTYSSKTYYLDFKDYGSSIYDQIDKASTHFGVNADNEDLNGRSKTYYFGTSQRRSLLSLIKEYFYLAVVNTKLGYSTSNSPLYQWQLISPDQYSSRPQLDALIAKIKADQTLANNQEVQAALAAAQAALDGNSGANMKTAVGDLTAAYTSNNESMKKLWSLLLTTETLLTDLRSMGIGLQDPYTYDYILGLHDTALGVYNTQALNPPIYKDAIDEQVLILTSLIQAISSEYLIYCKTMRDLILPLGYDIPRDDINDMVSKIMAYKQSSTTDNKSACDNKIEDVRTNFKNWVRTNNVVFLPNSDLTAYIKNHSFELKNYQNWTVTGTNPACTAADLQNKDGNNYLTCTNGNITISQTITGLPAGRYRLEAMFATNVAGTLSAGSEVAPIVTSDANTMVPTSVEFDADGENDVTITATKGDDKSYFKVDNFRLYIIGGASTQPSFNENNSAEPTYMSGEYPTVSATRTIYTDGDWNTLCLPFSLSTDETAHYFCSVREFSRLDKEDQKGNYLIVYSEADHIEAGVPYLVKGNKDREVNSTDKFFTEINAKNSYVVHNPVNPVHEYKNNEGKTEAMLMMQGNFVSYANGEIPYMTGQEDDKFAYKTYILQTGSKFKWIDSSSKVALKGFRAWFHLATPVSQQGSSSSLRIVFSEDIENTTAIESVASAAKSASFDLMGRQIAPDAKGLQIKNNKVVIVK